MQREAYLFYVAGQAVAAAHLNLPIRQVSGNPANAASEIAVPPKDIKARMILWLTGTAAEKKGVGRSDPLRRMRNRARMRAQLEAASSESSGPRAKGRPAPRDLESQAHDRANAICATLFEAIQEVVAKLRVSEVVPGEEIIAIVRAVKAKHAAAGEPMIEEAAAPIQDATVPPPTIQTTEPPPKDPTAM